MGTEKLAIGSAAPVFERLPGVDGKKYSIHDFDDKQVIVVAFTCNHCPYVQAYEDRLIGFQRDYGSKGVLFVCINSNETENYPEDNFDEMVKRSKSKGFNFPYLRDEDQAVATAYGATHTPEFFVFDKDRRLRYHGKMDDNYQNPKAVKANYLRNAVDAILVGKEVAEAETYSIGCTIKWKY